MMKESFFKNTLVNLRTFFSTNVRKRINSNTNRINLLEDAIANLDSRIIEKYHYLNLLNYYAEHENEAGPFTKELTLLQQSSNYVIFPYKPDLEPNGLMSGFDDATRLPFVIHKKKKLFFKAAYTKDEALNLYKNYLLTEKLLGCEDSEGAPHQYQSPRVHISSGDVIFDIGAAEGLFALDQIDKATHVVVVESDPDWIKPLQHTFAPYGNKVTILQKFVSATDTEETISLGKLLADFNYNSAFIKMDIEGYELPAIASAEHILKQKNVKLAIASYHKQHDAEELKTLFDRIDFYSEFSTGYMLFYLYDTPAPPFFRHGIIRATST